MQQILILPSLFLKFIFFFLIGFYILAVPFELMLYPQYTDALKPLEGNICIALSIISFAYSGFSLNKLIKGIWGKTKNEK